MLSRDQARLATTTIGVIVACAIAWFMLVDRDAAPRRRGRSADTRQRVPLKPPATRPLNNARDGDPIYIAIAPLPRPRPATQPAAEPNEFDEEAMLELEALLDEEMAAAASEPLVPVDVARHASIFVGADPEAEQVWYAAINDPNHSAEVRRELISALNEERFSDPATISAEDLPLIQSRIALIEEIAPDAIDENNAAAFEEVHQQLVNLLVQLAQQ
jgi:hypothetical protein